MMRFLATIVLSLFTVSHGFASEENEDWARQYSHTLEQARWNRQATDFYNELGKETASDEDRRLHQYFSSLKDRQTSIGDECVLWFKEFRPDLRLTKKAVDLYEKEMETLWNFVKGNGCWTATVIAHKSDQWTRMTCAADIIRLIRNYGGGNAKY